MKRGDILIAVLSGDYGKPRPVVLVQNEALFDTESLIVCPMTTEVGMGGPFRLLVQPSEINGLQDASAIMTEKLTAVPRRRCRERIGRLTDNEIQALNAGMMFVLGLDD